MKNQSIPSTFIALDPARINATAAQGVHIGKDKPRYASNNFSIENFHCHILDLKHLLVVLFLHQVV